MKRARSALLPRGGEAVGDFFACPGAALRSGIPVADGVAPTAPADATQ
ncbi:hypothetical protein [[Kitasatospora] papulosa]